MIERIKNIKLDEGKNYKVILEGYKNIEVNLNKIQKMYIIFYDISTKNNRSIAGAVFIVL